MKKEHFGAIAAVLVAFVVCRLFAFHLVDALGALTGHGRARGAILGLLLGLFPFAVLLVFALLQWRHVDPDRHAWLKPLAIAGWLVAGVVMGVLPYSRYGTRTHLLAHERVKLPGFLHALDVTIVVGLVACVVVLLLALAFGGLRSPLHAPRRDDADRAV